MKLFSQRDPAYQKRLLPKSKLTIGEAGCFVCSIAMLGQGDPVAMLSVKGGFAFGGLLYPAIMAKSLKMSYVGPSSTAPKGWCIGRTSAYAPQWPTHFLLVNMDTHEMVDPLKYPAKVEPLTYQINQFRVFDGIKFQVPSPPPVFEAPVDPPIPEWAFPQVEKAMKAGIQTPLTQPIGSMPLYQFLHLLDKYLSV